MSVELPEPEWVDYDVHGHTLTEVATAISEMAEAGRAEWFPHYDFDHDGDQVTDARVSILTRITLPRWTERESACAAEQHEWDRFLAALRTHEEGHVALVSQHLSAVDTWLIGQTPHDAASAWQHALTRLQQASEAYDSQTNHGRHTGAVIDLDIGAPS